MEYFLNMILEWKSAVLALDHFLWCYQVLEKKREMQWNFKNSKWFKLILLIDKTIKSEIKFAKKKNVNRMLLKSKENWWYFWFVVWISDAVGVTAGVDKAAFDSVDDLPFKNLSKTRPQWPQPM